MKSLKRELLTLEMMPSGWTTYGLGKNKDDKLGFCNKPEPPVPFTREQAGYEKTSLGPLMAETLRGYDSSSDAMRALSLSEKAAESCHEFRDHGETIRIQPLSFPRLGSATFAVRYTAKPITVDDTYVVVGSTIVQINAAGIIAQPGLSSRFTKMAVALVDRGQGR